MIKLEQKIETKALLPRIKQKSINDNTMYTIQLLRKTIHQMTNNYSEPQPRQMASKMLPAQKIRRLNYSYTRDNSQNHQSLSIELHQKASTQTITNFYIDYKKSCPDNYKMKVTKSPNIPINSIQIFQQSKNRFQTMDINDRFKNLKNRALSQKYGKRTRSVSQQK
ncbi:unnamed protein product [Paramecium primaurelia]|uniref:Uncharacterized protein n=1 Tax=Paramecium primaurelia TaxID=5886 RepID=A0A8S1QC51_PARPR|nr:unnamed protein product [Paramecium primaurelia]